jgi:hypothetical protein
MTTATRKRQPADESGAVFDRELEDLPQELRWREWMGRVEAVLFASASPVSREDLARVVGQGASVEIVNGGVKFGHCGGAKVGQFGASALERAALI